MLKDINQLAHNETDDILRLVLNSRGLRLTVAKARLLKLLSQHVQKNRAKLAKELHLSHGIPQKTTYSNLKALEKAGITSSMVVNDRVHTSLNQVFKINEQVIGCKNCGSVRNFQDKSIISAVNRLTVRRGYRHTSSQILVTGVCQKCSQLVSVT